MITENIVDSSKTLFYLLNLVLLLRQTLLDDVQGFQQFGGIVLADLLGESRLFLLQPFNLVTLLNDAVVQFLDDGRVVSVATLARRMRRRALVSNINAPCLSTLL